MTATHDGSEQEVRRPVEASSHADFSGTGRNVVQARDVHGPVNMFDVVRTEELPVPRQLPRHAAWLVGREEQLAFLDRMLPRAADEAHGRVPKPTVSVVSGMAGAGKTSLAVYWAHRVIDHYPDGQLYADLCGYASEHPEFATRVLDRFLRSLGIPDDRVPTDLQEKECLYRSLLAGRRIIVLLDNAATAAQVRPLLPGSGESAVVITSRCTLAGLDGAAYQTLEPLSHGDSISLLRRVLADARRDGDAELGELAEACAHLPLALRIAAQRAAHRPIVPLAEMVRALRSSEKRWDALSMQNGNEAEAVHSVFAWSYYALPPSTASFFRLLGNHPGPDVSIEVAAALTGTSLEKATVELDRLVDTHLIEQSEPRRYRMHDLTAAYARDRMSAQENAGIVDASWRRMIGWYLEAGYSAYRHMDYSAHFPLEISIPVSATAPVFVDRAEAAAWCDVEWPNLLAVAHAAIEHEHHDLVWKLAATLRFMHQRADRRQAGLALLKAALRSAELLGDLQAQGIILDSLTQMYSYLGQMPEFYAASQGAISIWHGLGDRYREAVSRLVASLELMNGRDWPRVVATIDEILSVAEELGQERLKAVNLGNLGEVMLECGELERASELIERALEIHRVLDWPVGLADTLWNFSRLMRAHGRHAEAVPLAEEALAQAQLTSDLELQGRTMLELAVVRHATGNRTDAAARYAQALAWARQENNRSGEARALGRLAVFHRDKGELRTACELHKLAIEICRDTDDQWYLAITLERYADTLFMLGNRRCATASRTEALGLFENFDEAAAAAARARLAAVLRQTAAKETRTPAAMGSRWADAVVVTRYDCEE